jgi:GT2 family glycosyltransferase
MTNSRPYRAHKTNENEPASDQLREKTLRYANDIADLFSELRKLRWDVGVFELFLDKASEACSERGLPRLRGFGVDRTKIFVDSVRASVDWVRSKRLRSHDNKQQLLSATADNADSQFNRRTSLKATYRTECTHKLEEFLAGSGTLSFRGSDRPKVSIIIVAFNQAELTFECLRSILDSAENNIEIIVWNNSSTDRTSEMLSRIAGIRVFNSDTNLHFIRGTNAAARHARGEYLLFLNNDTIILEKTISAAAACLDSDCTIGVVGGPIIYLDGLLQEAGAIIWQSGHTQGYGEGQDPCDWQFLSRREVDYCSGAFLMTRRSIFLALWGFDTIYEPAYFEDVDYCMRVRSSGLRVVYEPRASIIHYGYGSSENDRGPHLLYKKNHEIFIKRHSEVLQHAHCPQCPSLTEARIHGHFDNRVLIIDFQHHLDNADPSNCAIVFDVLFALTLSGCVVSYYNINQNYSDFSENFSNIWEMVEKPKCSLFELIQFFSYEKNKSSLVILVFGISSIHAEIDKTVLFSNICDSVFFFD